jgi:hypothetical protein
MPPRVPLPIASPKPLREGGHPVEHRVDRRHHVLAVDDDRGVAGGAQRHVKHRAVLGHVDLVAAEHGVDASAQPGALGQIEQQPQGLVGDEVLRVVEAESRRLEVQPLTPMRIFGEEIPKMTVLDPATVLIERLPGGTTDGRRGPGAGHAVASGSPPRDSGD